VGLGTANDSTDMHLFNAATRVTLGDGHKALSGLPRGFMDNRYRPLLHRFLRSPSARKPLSTMPSLMDR
jgi:hypothetical protein